MQPPRLMHLPESSPVGTVSSRLQKGSSMSLVENLRKRRHLSRLGRMLLINKHNGTFKFLQYKKTVS